MKKLLYRSCFLTFAVSFVFASLFPLNASAQWTGVAPAGTQGFNGQIHIVKFLDAFGLGKVGFVGDDTGIWRSNDGGVTWNRCTIVSPNNNAFPMGLAGFVNDISFQDGVHGYAITENVTGQPTPDAGVLRSSDSGVTWTFDDNIGTPDSGCGIYFNNDNGMLFVAGLDKGLVVSNDGGNTWKVLDTNTYYTGFAFNGNGYGVVTTQGSVQGQYYHYWKYTTDDGNTWSQSNFLSSSWQPIGIAKTETFFAATNLYILNITPDAIVRSDNGGAVWGPAKGFNPPLDTMTESMAGDACAQFASSSAKAIEMDYSINDGNFWSTLNPTLPNFLNGPAYHTRFYVSPTKVWSFGTLVTGKYDSIYSAPRPTSADIHIWPDSINFSHAACAIETDTVIHIFGCNCANSPTLTGDSIHQFVPGTTDTITTTPKFPPSHPLCVNGVGVTDSIIVHVLPHSPNVDSADVHVLFNDNGVAVDTPIYVKVSLIPTKPTFTATTINIREKACDPPFDSDIYICNPSCQQIILQQCSNELNPCPDQLIFSGCNNLPATLNPGDCQPFHIHFSPGLKISDCCASFVIDWSIVGNNTQYETPPITVCGHTTTNLKPTARGVNINVKNCCSAPTDTAVYFLNNTCDTIILDNPIMSYGTNSACNGTFDIDSGKDPSRGLFGISFPDTIPPAGLFSTAVKFPIIVHCQGTNCSETLIFRYTILQNGNGTFENDTIHVPLTLSSGGVIPAPTISPASLLDFGSVSCCDSTEVKTVTITASCKPDTITSFGLSDETNFYIVPPGIMQMKKFVNEPDSSMPANGTRTFQIGFRPRCAGGNGGADNATVTVKLKSGVTLGPVRVKATATNLASASKSVDTLDLGTLNECASTCDSVTIKNTSCGSIKMQVLNQPTKACFTLSNVPTDTIGQYGSRNFTVCINAAQCGATGQVTDFAVLQYTDGSGNSGSPFDTIWFTANINPPVPGYTITAITDTTICVSQTASKTFTLTDTGTCYNYNITSISSGDAQASVSPQTASLTPGQSQTFTVNFNPTQTGTFTGPIVLTNADGTTISEPYSFTSVDTCNKKGTFQLVITPDSIGVPNCQTGPITITATANGGGTGTINSLTVTGSNRFSVTGPTSGPLPFTSTITFDPNQVGANTASTTLSYTFNGTNGDTIFTVKGGVGGVMDSAHIGVIDLTNNCVRPNDTDLDSMAIVLRDNVPAATGLTTLSFDIVYNANLLFNPNPNNIPYDPAPNWTPTITILPNGQGLHVVLNYSGAGPITAGTILLKLRQFGAISTSLKTQATATNVHFNDSTFEACTMRALSSGGDVANICIDTVGCGRDITYLMMTGQTSLISNIVVVPNPVHKDGSTATLHFQTNVTANVTAEILDQLGRSTVLVNNGSLTAGDHDLSIPTDRMAEGIYFARVSVGGVTVVRQFVLEKE